MNRSPFKILQKNIGLHEIPDPWGNLSPICDVNFTNNMSKSDWTWQNLWDLLTINFKYRYYYTSLDWSGLFIFKCISLHGCQKFLDLYKIFRLLENAFVNLPYLWHDLIINLPCRTAPQNFSPICYKKLLEKGPSILHTYFGETLFPCSNGKLCGNIRSLHIFLGEKLCHCSTEK